jgi:hypothetical protein
MVRMEVKGKARMRMAMVMKVMRRNSMEDEDRSWRSLGDQEQKGPSVE